MGLAGTNTVTQIQGRPVASTAPGGGQSLAWNISTNRWEPQTIGGSGSSTLAGDVVGPSSSNTVTQLQGRQVLSTAPTAGQALVWNGSTSRWEPQTITGSGGAPMASQMGDLIVTQTGGTVLTIGPNCSFVAPCNVRFGALTYALNKSCDGHAVEWDRRRLCLFSEHRHPYGRTQPGSELFRNVRRAPREL